MDEIRIYPSRRKSLVISLIALAAGTWGALFYFSLVNWIPTELYWLSPLMLLVALCILFRAVLFPQPSVEISDEGIATRNAIDFHSKLMRWADIDGFVIAEFEGQRHLGIVPTQAYIEREKPSVRRCMKLNQFTFGIAFYLGIAEAQLPGTVEELKELLELKHEQLAGGPAQSEAVGVGEGSKQDAVP